MKQERTVAQQFKTAVNTSDYTRAVALLRELPHDEVLETLVVVLDTVTPKKRINFLSALEPSFVEDVEVLDLFGCL